MSDAKWTVQYLPDTNRPFRDWVIHGPVDFDLAPIACFNEEDAECIAALLNLKF